MSDGTEQSVEVTTQQLLPPPIVDAKQDKEYMMLPQGHSNAKQKFLSNARDMAIGQANENYRDKINPYEFKPALKAIRDRAQIMHTMLNDAQYNNYYSCTS